MYFNVKALVQGHRWHSDLSWRVANLQCLLSVQAPRDRSLQTGTCWRRSRWSAGTWTAPGPSPGPGASPWPSGCRRGPAGGGSRLLGEQHRTSTPVTTAGRMTSNHRLTISKHFPFVDFYFIWVILLEYFSISPWLIPSITKKNVKINK